MAPRLRHICGYGLCIIPKYMQIYFYIFRTNIVTYLQQKSVGRHTHNSVYSTTSDPHYKNKVFPGVECLHATVKDADQCILYTPIKPNIIIHMECALGFCNECPKYIIPDEKLDDRSNSPLVHFSVYTYQGRCAKYGIIKHVPTLWKICGESDDINNGLIKSPTYGKNKHITKISCYIGEFHMEK